MGNGGFGVVVDLEDRKHAVGQFLTEVARGVFGDAVPHSASIYVPFFRSVRVD